MSVPVRTARIAHILSVAIASLLFASAWAQAPAGGNSRTPPAGRGGAPSGLPDSNIPGSPGTPPQDQQDQTMDRYAADKDFVRSAAESSASAPALKDFAAKDLAAQRECRKQAEDFTRGAGGASDHQK